MLRRKLLLFLASLVGLLLIVSVIAIWLLQGVLGQLDHAATRDAAVLEAANQMGTSITQIEIELREIQLGRQRHLDALIDAIETLHAQTNQFGGEYSRPLPEATPLYENIQKNIAAFERHIAMLATTQDTAFTAAHIDKAMTASIALRQDILTVGRMMRQHVAQEQRHAVARLRYLVLGLGIVFLLVINISVLVMLRMANMVLRPVDELVEASKRLAREEFDYRVGRQADEFGQLAEAYNKLAEQLQANEQRKLETLAQTAVMLNHELNNASAIIKLQLQLLERQSTGNPSFERCLRQISDSLARMTATLEALKRIRRIVLTDYNEQTKMLDLQKSVAVEG